MPGRGPARTIPGMTTATRAAARPATPAERRDLLLYRLATGALCAVFAVSVLLTFGDLDGTRAQLADLGFPTYFAIPQGVAKVLGIVAILSRRSRTLTYFAYAGFLFDLLLALTAHIAERETYGLLAAAALVIWVAAFWADRRRFGAAAYPA